jgi:hypothetical protein
VRWQNQQQRRDADRAAEEHVVKVHLRRLLRLLPRLGDIEHAAPGRKRRLLRCARRQRLGSDGQMF